MKSGRPALLRDHLFAAAAALLVAAACACAPARGESPRRAPGPHGPEQAPWRRQLWLIPSPVPGLLMRATVLRPPGAGPFPLMVMNHGSTESAERRADMALPTYPAVSQWFLRRGYAVVLPQRPGHGRTGGPYLEDQHGCDHADFLAAGRGAAASIAATIASLRAQPFVRRTGIVVVGQSAGGWGALALAGLNPPGVRAVINFAGGRGGRSYDRPDSNCAPDRLLAAARDFGRTARVPTLWLYAANDSYFAPTLSRKLAEAFRTAGGRAEYHLLPAFGPEGHFLAESDAAAPLWSPLVARFLDRVP